MTDQSSPMSGEEPPESDESSELAPPPLSQIGQNDSSPGEDPDKGSLGVSTSEGFRRS
jgi:hypothetical protein